MSYTFEVEGGTTVKFPVGGKYCDRDIVVTAIGGGEGDMSVGIDAMLTNNVKKIDSNIDSVRNFACYALTSLETLNLPNATRIGDQSFRGCTKVTKINAPKTTYIGSYAFYTCTTIKEINFPSVVTIGASAFAYCYALEKADFGAVTSIGASTFDRSSVFDTLILRSATIATLANVNAFNNTKIARGEGFVYVPDNLVESYKTATNWSTYASQIKPLSELEV